MERLQYLLQWIGCRGGCPQHASGAIERTRDCRAFPRDERARARVESHHFGGSHLRRRTPTELLELARQGLGLGGVRVGPAGRLAYEDLEIIDRAGRDLLGRDVPATPTFTDAARECLQSHGRARDRLLTCHQRAAAERARQPHQLLRRRRRGLLHERIQAIEILPRLEGEEVRHPERRRARLGHGWNNISRLGARWPWCLK